MMKRIFRDALWGFVLAVTVYGGAMERKITPEPGSLKAIQDSWKEGDTILLAPGEYYGSFRSNERGGVAIKAETPGTAVIRGDVDAPEFEDAGNGIWKTSFPAIPEAVNERDTMTIMQFVPTVSQLRKLLGAWTYDDKTKTLSVRTTDAEPPSKHFLTISVTPNSGINFYVPPKGKGIRDISLEGFLVTGFYNRTKNPGMTIPFSQYGVCWGVVINRPLENVSVKNITAFLNSYGIGFCGTAQDSLIENCRAFGNRNPYHHSGGGIGIMNGSKNCTIRSCVGADNFISDIWVYAGNTEKLDFSHNICYGSLRTKSTMMPGAMVESCIAGSATFLTVNNKAYLKNSVVSGYVDNSLLYRNHNLLLRYDKEINVDSMFADPFNFDFRPQATAPDYVKKNAPAPPSEKLFFLKSGGDDAPNGLSVRNAFGSIGHAARVLTSGSELYIVSAVEGDIILKNLDSIAIRGRGKYPVTVKGKIILEDCSGVNLERLAPEAIRIKRGREISVTQCAPKIFVAEKTDGLRLTHSLVEKSEIMNSTNIFVTANVFGSKKMSASYGWSNYNAYPDVKLIPADENYSFTAIPLIGENYTFKNSYLFNGRAIDGMPVGPFRRQPVNTALKLETPVVSSLAETFAVITVAGNMLFNGIIYWGNDESCPNRLNLEENASSHSAVISGLDSGREYFFRIEARANAAECFSNQTLSYQNSIRTAKTSPATFTTLLTAKPPREYFVSVKTGNDAATGTQEAPFLTISHAVSFLSPGDTLTIREGVYAESIDITVSGTKENPITIRGASGEKVILSGGKGCYIQQGITIKNQADLIFENLRIAGTGMYPNEGIMKCGVEIVNSSSIKFSRVIFGGCSWWTLQARNSPGLRFENCVLFGGHGGSHIADSENLIIRNCVFLFGGVTHLMVMNHSGEKVTFENNIVADTLNMKGGNALIYVHNIDAFTERNNCFFTRLPEDEKPILGWNIANGKLDPAKAEFLGRRQVPYKTYLLELERPAVSFFANPDLPVMPQYRKTYTSFADWKENWPKNQTVTWPEIADPQKNNLLEEFESFKPSNKEVIKRNCGLSF